MAAQPKGSARAGLSPITLWSPAWCRSNSSPSPAIRAPNAARARTSARSLAGALGLRGDEREIFAGVPGRAERTREMFFRWVSYVIRSLLKRGIGEAIRLQSPISGLQCSRGRVGADQTCRPSPRDRSNGYLCEDRKHAQPRGSLTQLRQVLVARFASNGSDWEATPGSSTGETIGSLQLHRLVVLENNSMLAIIAREFMIRPRRGSGQLRFRDFQSPSSVAATEY